MPRRVEDYRGLTRVSRLRLLHAVHQQPGRRLAELADEVGLHLNTAREHLWVLEDEGLVTSLTLVTGVRGRPPVVFHPVEDAETNPAAERRIVEATERGEIHRRLSPELDYTAELGEAATRQIDVLYEHLDDIGLEPKVDDARLTIDLAPCRYGFAIETERALVCSVHIRLLQQQLQQVPGPLALRRVQPFVTPTRCTVTLAMAEATDEADPQSGADPRP
ncbi:helix-turn-helix domain-containing protein [Leucobacter sp. G161]|uniref:helix-turn-helix domain-containing protein n=1 Tax=Leucobacter sp. G161 TaxID=663704 RepID=UPI00073C299E|nr:helix-turn-helix domain-containing protein [Leucobacter sp. G161]KUF06211.1 hypothetical protein AUL38_02805 [Leucobacter sp. G161]